MMEKIAVLLNRPEDLNYVQREFSSNVLFVAHEIHTIQILRKNNIEYFYEPSKTSDKEYEDVKYFIHNWYRDESSEDLAVYKGISVAQIICGSAWISIASYYREYTAVKRWLEKVDILYVSKNEHPRFLKVCKAFDKKVKIYDPNHSRKCIYSACGGRILNNYPVIHPLSKLARLLQIFFIFIVKKKKNLYLGDWTNVIASRKDPYGLSQNSLKLWKGFYFVMRLRFIKEAEEIFPKSLGNFAEVSHLKRVIKRNNLIWDSDLLKLCSDSLKENYLLYRQMGVRTYSVFKELFLYYQPYLCIIPGESMEGFILVAQLAKNLGIKTRYMVDGYEMLTLEPAYRDIKGNKWLLDEFCSYGDAVKQNYITAGVFSEQCIDTPPPVLTYHQNLSKPNRTLYKVMVMAWIPMHLNPNGREEYISQILVDVVKMVTLNINNVAVKIKSESQREFYTAILKEEGLLEKVEIISGSFFKHVLSSDIIIGGISTSAIEAFYHKVPYYIYEPFENGYTDEMIEKSSILDIKGVARTIKHLKKNIEDRRIGVKVGHDSLFFSPN